MSQPKLFSIIDKACFEYKLIEEGDRILIGASGGQDEHATDISAEKPIGFGPPVGRGSFPQPTSSAEPMIRDMKPQCFILTGEVVVMVSAPIVPTHGELNRFAGRDLYGQRIVGVHRPCG